MSKTFIPQNYRADLDLYDTQTAIGSIKEIFIAHLSRALHLRRVTAPLFVDPKMGLNDDLNGVERPVSFDVPSAGKDGQVVHSLAKWKRMALHQYGFRVGRGLYTDMNAIRRDEDLDNLHSIYVDQWDWEKVITEDCRTEEYLKSTVQSIVNAIVATSHDLRVRFPQIKTSLTPDVTFVTSQELEDLYPDMTSKERENAFTKEHKTVFIMKIGDLLQSGKKHDGRAPDYDDWQLNGDILFWHEPLNCAVEISSMGIRVDAKAMDEQLKKSGCDSRREYPFHKMVLENRLPLTIGGGIGQSRLCMLLLGKIHVGEVQVSLWDEETLRICKEHGVEIL
ncbi:MAG: aspartate--ammonia ligase [Clostridia bacterium]|nr:aspartate--ammonia ligase [Clostridia bacterium]